MNEQEAYKAWLADEASPAEVYMHRQAANSAACWRVIAAKRLLARQAANTPWSVKKTANAA
jgi:hypothetical protein